jgi:hypothetical protein
MDFGSWAIMYNIGQEYCIIFQMPSLTDVHFRHKSITKLLYEILSSRAEGRAYQNYYFLECEGSYAVW